MFLGDGRLCAGGGATEIELARQLYSIGESCPGMEQYAMKKFAEALEVVPRTLAENSGQVATEAISSLYAAHQAGATKHGVDISDGSAKDMSATAVLDVLATKRSAVKLAADAAITVMAAIITAIIGSTSSFGIGISCVNQTAILCIRA